MYAQDGEYKTNKNGNGAGNGGGGGSNNSSNGASQGGQPAAQSQPAQLADVQQQVGPSIWEEVPTLSHSGSLAASKSFALAASAAASVTGCPVACTHLPDWAGWRGIGPSHDCWKASRPAMALDVHNVWDLPGPGMGDLDAACACAGHR